MISTAARAICVGFAVVVGAACGASNAGGDATADVGPSDAALDVIAPDAGPPQRPEDCDPIDQSACALPWPSNRFLRADPSSPTGYRLAFGTALPANRQRRTINPEPWSRLDGYGLGVPIMTLFDDLDASMFADENHIDRSLAPDAPIVLFEVRGGVLTRVPYWAELDLNEPMVSRRVLIVRPAVILRESSRYIVAFRGLRTRAGTPVAPSAAFARLRDRMTAGDPALAARQARFDEVFTLLDGAGVTRSSLVLAWDWVTASSASLHGRLLAMVDDALAAVGADGPRLTVTAVQEFAPTADGSGRTVDPNIALEISGTFDVPNYLRSFTSDFIESRSMVLDAMGRPMRDGTRSPQFWIRVPHSAIGGMPHALLQYGHGLFGLGSEARAGYLGAWANRAHYIIFSSSLAGMSEHDLAFAITAMADGSRFPSVGDGLHQGLTEWALLARAMRQRVAALSELVRRNVMVDATRLHYSGNSQGGIFGGTYMAISPDIQYGHLGVGGANYSLLLQRSADFTTWYQFLRQAYRTSMDHLLFIAVAQLLWDSTDPVSYLSHIANAPFPGRMRHDVIADVARGDHQVAVVTTEVVARSDIGLPLMANYDRDRMPWGIPQAPYPRRGSGIVLFNFGNAWPPIGNLMPGETLRDPHGMPRAAAWHQDQISHFFRTGEIIDACGGDGCTPM